MKTGTLSFTAQARLLTLMDSLQTLDAKHFPVTTSAVLDENSTRLFTVATVGVGDEFVSVWNLCIV